MAGGSEVFACPGCGKKFRWKADLAGRKVRCSECNLKVRIPAAAGTRAEALEPLPQKPPAARREPRPAPKPEPKPPAEDESYDLNLDDDLAGLAPRGPVAPVPVAGGGAAGGDGRCPSCNQKVKPGAVICINCGFNLQAGKKLKTKVEADAEEAAGGKGKAAGAAVAAATSAPTLGGAYASAAKRFEADEEARIDLERQHRKTELWTPLGVLLAGLALVAVNAFVLAPLADVHGIFSAMGWAVFVLVGSGVRTVLQLPVLVVIIFLVAKMFGTSFGPLGTAMLKLLAVAVFIGAFDDSVGFGLDIITGGFGGIGWMLTVSLSFGVFWILATWILEMEALEVLVAYLLLIFLPILVMGFVLAVLFTAISP